MATTMTTQVGNGKYQVLLETDNREYYLYVQRAVRTCIDMEEGKEGEQLRWDFDEPLRG